MSTPNMSTATTPPAVRRYLTPPRAPRACPVHVVRYRSPSGDLAWIVEDPRGLHVETVTGGVYDNAESVLNARYPWTSTYALDHYAPRILDTFYPSLIDVTAAEFRRIARGPEELDERTAALRADADRRQRFAAVVAALQDIRRSTGMHEWRERIAAREGRPNHYGDTRSAVVYHRHPDDGGDHVSDHLRRALAALARAGMVERTDTPGADAAPFFHRSVGQYRATDTTPKL